jgi:phosphoglycolate phosphatase
MKAQPSSQKIKVIAFDFDGTLADSFEVFVHAAELALKRKQPFTAQEVEDLRQHSMREVITLLNIKKWQLPWFVIRGMREINRQNDSILLFQDIPEVLQSLSQSGYKLYIVSSHSKAGITKCLERYHLSEYFDQIYANVGLWGKPNALKKLQQQHNFNASECVFVGDEVRDIEAADKTGMQCIAVTWGFNTAKVLKAHNPTVIVDQPEDIINAVQQIS